MEYRSKYKAEEIEAILDAKNNTGEGVDSNLDVMFTGQLQTKEVEVSADTTIKADEGFLGLKEVSVKVSGGGGSASGAEYDGYYLLDWSAIKNEEGYDRAVAKEVLQTLDFCYYLAYRLPSGVTMTTNASIMSDEENWHLGNYRSMRWKMSDTSTDAEIGNVSPKDFLTFLGADNPLAQIMANRMTECTKEEFYAQ